MEKKLVGYSLSFCVRDIIRGKVSLDQVDQIITGTKAGCDESWEELLRMYCEVYWVENPVLAREVVAKLREAGKIRQPRLNGCEAPNICEGHWDELARKGGIGDETY